MLTLVHIRRAPQSAADTAALIAAYTQFDRRRTSRRQYVTTFGGMAVLVLLGATFRRVPANEAVIVAALLAVPPLILLAIEIVHRRRLARRLDRVRMQVQSVG